MISNFQNYFYRIIALLVFIVFVGVQSSCNQKPARLPIYGEREFGKTMVNGKEVMDTIYQTVPAFSFIDQDSNVITNETFKGKIYVADFVFLSCKSICPKMHIQMKKLYEHYKDTSSIIFLSHTIDPENDTLQRIKTFMRTNGIETSKWHMVRGTEEEVLKIANRGYFSIAYRDSANVQPGQEFQHEGWMILVDKQGRVRSMKDGTDQFEVEKLMKDIDLLLQE